MKNMKTLKKDFKDELPIILGTIALIIVVIIFLLRSCGTYAYAPYDGEQRIACEPTGEWEGITTEDELIQHILNQIGLLEVNLGDNLLDLLDLDDCLVDSVDILNFDNDEIGRQIITIVVGVNDDADFDSDSREVIIRIPIYVVDPESDPNDPNCVGSHCIPNTDPDCLGPNCIPETHPDCVGDHCIPNTNPGCIGVNCIPETHPDCEGDDCIPNTNPGCIGVNCIPETHPDCEGPDCILNTNPDCEGINCDPNAGNDDDGNGNGNGGDGSGNGGSGGGGSGGDGSGGGDTGGGGSGGGNTGGGGSGGGNTGGGGSGGGSNGGAPVCTTYAWVETSPAVEEVTRQDPAPGNWVYVDRDSGHEFSSSELWFYNTFNPSGSGYWRYFIATDTNGRYRGLRPNRTIVVTPARDAVLEWLPIC